ncbi:CHAT domain-containing protein [Tolypothrix sp. PCC 7910]|uniref:CHAT domain-containing protein n=1 Tax=Tolypothrix sp. PCC 7910 TaxID=2099387 RepID=UPI00142772C8|nr:CHAT domain-containing tetratricopeptide repeat protein [Tolypothrix sp. PCC 7910]QIR38826.1 CHAT domain-containing protein [Tolypothrix sp. PCC 7910]
MAKGFGTGQRSVKPNRKYYLDFLRKIIWAIGEGKADIPEVYRLLQHNLDKLNKHLPSVLRDWATTTLPKLDFSKAYNRALAITNFSKIIQEFPAVSRVISNEIAIVAYETAGIVFTKMKFPQKWAEINDDLGNAYCDRIGGDWVQNLEKAIAAFQSALQVYTCEEYPEDWARTQNNLATAYSDWIGGNRKENLELALLCCNNALQIYVRELYPQDWAMVLTNLGAIYRIRMQGDEVKNLKTAIDCYKAALEEYTYERFPEDWAGLQNNLGNAYRELYEGNRAENLEQSLDYFNAALKVYTRESLAQDWAMVQNNLALTYYEQGEIEQAIVCFRLSLEICTPTVSPTDCLQYGGNFGDKALTLGRWAEAIEGYDFAIKAVEQIRAWSHSESRREQILQGTIEVYQKMVQACINAGEIEKAFEYAERSRSKRLVDLMASNDLYQSGEIPPAVKELLQQYEELQQQIDRERVEAPLLVGRHRPQSNDNASQTRAVFQAYNEAIALLEAQKQQVWENLRRLDPVLAGEIQVSAPNFSAIQKLIDQPTTAIVSFYTTDNDTHIFIVRENQITLHTCTGQGLETLQQWIFENWLLVYVGDRQTWNSQINPILSELAQRLQLAELISQHLEGIKELILVPHLLLHQIPFAALPIGNNQYLGDKFLIRYTPSCQILEFCQQRDKIESCDQSYGTVEDATDDLPCASFEGEQLAKLYNIPHFQRLRGSIQATKANYRQLAEQVQVLHGCHHAESCLDNPLASYLKLGDGNITLGQLMSPGWRLPNLSDVFLSCCETNLGIPELTDDILTLSTGFLCAGARSVVSTLWAVDDLATAVFSVFYYQHRQQGKSRPEALRKAQISLRNLRKEDVKKISPEAEARERELIKSRKQYSPGTVEYREWEREYKMYARFNRLIQSLESSTEEFPFLHPRYWSAFICQGLR